MDQIMNNATPKGQRLHIAIMGRTNVGKSSILNLIAGQDVSIISPVPGTTTDVVEKAIELLPIGPVVLLDTGGVDDATTLGEARIARALKVLDRADIVILVREWDCESEVERALIEKAASAKIPVVTVFNKSDLHPPPAGSGVLACTATLSGERERFLPMLKRAILDVCPDDLVAGPPLVGDLVPAGGLVVLVVPIDLQAPKGRLILPQVQTIRDALDSDAGALVVKERELGSYLSRIGMRPDLVVCDSQAVLKMVADTPADVPCTTFSILMARMKGDLPVLAAGAAAIDSLHDGDSVLIAESCSHHPLEDDIGRVKIPRWLRQYTGAKLEFETCAGLDFPADLGRFRLAVQCGGCMHNRRAMLTRIGRCIAAGVPITNYGLCIAFTQGVLERVLSPFPAALEAFRDAKDKCSGFRCQRGMKT
jgi:[FeFe] hydrogenase H-cluster maturation GTPase HydF